MMFTGGTSYRIVNVKRQQAITWNSVDLINGVLRHLTKNVYEERKTPIKNKFEYYTFRMTTTSYSGQWVNPKSEISAWIMSNNQL